MSPTNTMQGEARRQFVVFASDSEAVWAAELVSRLLQTAADPISVSVTVGTDGNLNPERREHGVDYILIIPGAVDALASAMARGDTPSVATRAWAESLERVLAFHRRDRQHSTLLDLADLAAADSTLIADRLGARLGLSLSGVATGRIGLSDSPTLLRMVAFAALADAGVRSLRGEVEASTLAISDSGATLDADEVFLAYRQASSFSEQGALSPESGSLLLPALPDPENQLLRDQVARLTDQIASIYASNSWRVTGPLRRVSALLAGRRQ